MLFGDILFLEALLEIYLIMRYYLLIKKNLGGNTMKKIFSLLLILCMVLQLAACSSKDKVKETSEDSNKQVSTDSNKTNKKEDKKVETFSLMMYTDWYKAGWEAVIKDIEENQKDLGFRLEVEQISGGTQGKQIFQARIAAGEAPDFFEFQSVSDVIRDLGGADILEDISGEWTKNYSQELLNSKFYSYEGKVVGLPIDPAVLVGTFYNKKIFDELKLEVPTTWEELLAVCEKIKQAGKVPFFYPGKDTWALTMMLNEGFIREYEAQNMTQEEFFEKVNTNQIKFKDLEQVKDAIAKSKELIDKGYVQETYLSDNYDMSQKAVAKGEAAMIFQGTWVMDEIYGKYPEDAKDIGAFAIPFDGTDASSQFVPFAFFMSNNCHNKELGKKVVEYLASREVQQIFADAQPGLWTHKGVESELLPAVKDMKKWMDDEMVQAWFGYGFKYAQPTFDIYIQDYYAGAREVEGILEEGDSEYKRNALAQDDSNWE